MSKTLSPRPVSVAVLGAGTQGSSLAMRLAMHGGMAVTLVDPKPASGASGKQDGRLHSGGTGLAYDDLAVLRRKLAGNTALRNLFPQALDTARPALYGFTCDHDGAAFVARAAQAGLPLTPAAPTSGERAWFAPGICSFHEAPEYAFDTVRLTHAYIEIGRAHGLALLADRAVSVARTPGGAWAVRLGSGEIRAFDAVVNALGAFMADVTVDGEEGAPADQVVSSWPIAVVGREGLPPCDRVLVRADPLTRMASVVPHTGVLAVDAKPFDPRTIRSASALAGRGPRAYEPGESGERRMIETLREAYAPLARLPDAAFTVVVCAHLRGAPDPAAPHRTVSDLVDLRHPRPGYFERLGGLATTSALDALDAAAAVETALGLASFDPLEAMTRLAGRPPALVEGALTYARPDGRVALEAAGRGQGPGEVRGRA